MKEINKLPAVDGTLGWYETSPWTTPTPGRQVTGTLEFDVLIGRRPGFTGLSAAHRLAELEPDCRIALVDALKVGQGTSGRNAGFIIDLPHNLDADKPDIEFDRQIHALNRFSIARLDSIRQRHNINCQWQQAGKYLGAHESRHLDSLDAFTRTLRALDTPYEVLKDEELAQRLGTRYYRQAVYTPGNILMNPAALAQGVASALPTNVTLFEQSPVAAVEYGEPHRLHFSGGVLEAKTLALCTNAFGEEFGLFRNRLAPIFTYASLTPPLNAAQVRHHFTDVAPWGMTSAHPAGTTVRYTPDHRLFIRNSFSFETSLRSNHKQLARAQKRHRASFEARFPGLSGVPFEYTWGGMLCMTLNHQSVFTRAANNLYALSGMNGGWRRQGYLSGLLPGRMDRRAQQPRA